MMNVDNLFKKGLQEREIWKAKRNVFKHMLSPSPAFDEARESFSTKYVDLPPKNLKEAVYSALCFFDIFDHALTFDELNYALMVIKTTTEELLLLLSQETNIQFQEGFYFLKGRESLIEIRKKRLQTIHKFQKKIRRFLPFIQLVPYVRMVGICNTLAMNTANEQSDIDLFIITATGRIFLARTLTTLLFTFLGVRRHGVKIAGRFCLSFYMDEEYLNLQKIMNGPEDIYLLYWFRTLQLMYGEDMYKKFIHENNWIDNKYFKNKETINTNNPFRTNKLLNTYTTFLECILDRTIAPFIEKKLANIQHKRHQKNLQKLGAQASVIVDHTMLKFHNIDRRKEFIEKYKERLERFYKR